MFPIEASAPISCNAALRLAKVSGKLVPIAMMVIPLTLFLRPATQPNSLPSCEKEKPKAAQFLLKILLTMRGKALKGQIKNQLQHI